MNEEKSRIDTLLATGKISAEEHRLLVSTVDRVPSSWRRTVSLALNPFASVSSMNALVTGVVLLAVMSWLAARVGIYFPGVLDLQIVHDEKFQSFGILILQNVLAVGVLTFLFWLGAKLSQKPSLRILDFLGFVAFSRWPYLFFTLVMSALLPLYPAILPHHGDAREASSIAILAIMGVIVLVWYLVLLFHALREASGTKGAVLWTNYVVSILAAEALTVWINHSFLL